MKLFIFVFSLFFLIPFAFGQSIGISPAVLDFYVGEEERKNLFLFNQNDFQVRYKLTIPDYEEFFLYEEDGELREGSRTGVPLTLLDKNIVKGFETVVVITYFFEEKGSMALLPQAKAKIRVHVGKTNSLINLMEAIYEENEKEKKADVGTGIIIIVFLVVAGIGLFYLVKMR